MKKQILKIAGVKSEKEFYKKFPTEEAFMAKHGKELKKAQIGTYMTSESAPTMYNPINTRDIYDQLDYQVTGMTDAERRQLAALKSAQTGLDITGTLSGPQLTPTAQNLQQQQFNWGTNPNIPSMPTGASKKKVDLSKGIPVISGVISGIQNIKAQKKAYKQAQQQTKLTDVMAQAAASRPKQSLRRQYVRPEDVIVQPEQMFPSYGVGTNVLAQDGTVIGGTPTEIQNMYNPGTLYSDLGYEPLDDTSKMKQFQAGGGLAALNSSQFGQALGSPEAQQLASLVGGNAAGGYSQVFGSIGGLAGGPIGTMATFVGAALDREKQKQIENQQRLAKENISNIVGQNFGMGLQSQLGSFMQDGGETSPYKWVSHTWQPQVITTFGEHKLKDLLTPPKDADMLRAGGHLKEYTPPSPAAMSTERPAMQMGGELQTHWGGYAETLSQNPYLPDGGETIMFRGQSHDESDGKGNTGIGITYGDNPVEVERGEPAMKLKDGGTGDSNLTVFGNIKITNGFADMLGDPKSKDKKFKTYVADLSKQENKQNKLVEKSVEKLDGLDVLTSFDKLALGTLQANIEGANAKLKDLAEKKMNAAALQNAINDTKEEELLEVTDSGDVKARKGANIPKAQGGRRISDTDYKELRTLYEKAAKEKYGTSVLEFQRKFHKLFPDEAKKIIATMGPTLKAQKEFKGDVTKLEGNEDMYFGPRTKQYMTTAEKIFSELPRTAVGIPGDKKVKALAPITPSATPSKTIVPSMTVPKKTNVIPYINEALRYLRPSDVEELDPNQLLGEMYALSNNQVTPVGAQKFQPELGVPYDISLQDILNENEASFRAQQRLVGYNPAAQNQLSAQKYAANQKVLGEQFRLNQAEKQRVYEQNRNLLNQAKLQNLGILDQQYVRQQEALSKTKATTQAALSSIASKYAQNKLENRTLAVYENMYNYRFDPKFRAINMNPLVDWDTNIGSAIASGKTTGGLAPGYEFTYDANGNIIGTRKSKSEEARNGSIVKNLKNL